MAELTPSYVRIESDAGDARHRVMTRANVAVDEAAALVRAFPGDALAE